MRVRRSILSVGISASLLLCGVTSQSPAGSFDANFTCSNDLGRALYPYYTSIPGYEQSGAPLGFTYQYGTGGLTISQAAGYGNGELQFPTSFTISGDFSASVVVSRQGLGTAELGLMVTDQYVSSLIDIYFHASSDIVSNTFPLVPNPTYLVKQTEISNSNTSVTFRISRRGNRLVSAYDDGAGFVVLNSSTDVAGYGAPVKVSLFLIEAYNDTGAHQGSFSSLRISAVSLGSTCVPPAL